MTFIGALAGLPGGALMMLPGEVLLPQNRAAGMGLFYVVLCRPGILRDASGVALSMPYEHSNQCPPKPPLCASSSRTMQLARTTSRFGDLPDLYTFECRACGVSHIEAAYIEVA